MEVHGVEHVAQVAWSPCVQMVHLRKFSVKFLFSCLSFWNKEKGGCGNHPKGAVGDGVNETKGCGLCAHG